MTKKDALKEAREAGFALGNDPPNGVTTMRALDALYAAADEIERLRAALEKLRTACMASDDFFYAAMATEALVGSSVEPSERQAPAPTPLERDAMPGGWAQHPSFDGNRHCLGRTKDGRDCVLPMQHEGDCEPRARAYGPGMTPHAEDCGCHVCDKARVSEKSGGGTDGR